MTIKSKSILERKWVSIYGSQTVDDFLTAFSKGKISSIRINTLVSSIDETINKLSSKGFIVEKEIPKCGFLIRNSPFNLGITTEHLGGYFFIQGLSSQIAIDILAPSPGEKVADCCAAPGGKTSHMAQIMDNKGTIIAIERNRKRIFPLKNNLQRCGVKNCIGVHGDSRRLHEIGIKFDTILVDAPCTGTGTLHKNIDKLSNYRIEDSKILQKIQLDILNSAFKSLKPNGKLLYCTCSLEPEENECVIDGFLDNHGNQVEIQNIDLRIRNAVKPLNSYNEKDFSSSLSKCVRILPNDLFEGFFMCLIKKM